MLVLGRKENETILIGDDIRITIVGRSGSTVRLGIEAPKDVKIRRGELPPPEEGGSSTDRSENAGITAPADNRVIIPLAS